MSSNFNQIIKEWRKESGMTLEEISKFTNMTPQAISLYEKEKRAVSFDTLQLFADAFNKEIVVSSRNKGMPLTDKQREKVKNICKFGGWVDDIYRNLKELFDITEEEIYAGKLFDDMTMDEYIRYSPIKVENGETTNLHQEEVFFYYYCQGAEFSLENGEIIGVAFPNSIPDFIPPRRISKDGFITEQRRLLLPLLQECFSLHVRKDGQKSWTYNIRRLKNDIGF